MVAERNQRQADFSVDEQYATATKNLDFCRLSPSYAKIAEFITKMSFQHGSLGASSHSLIKIKPKIKPILFFFNKKELHRNTVNNFMPKKLENAHTVGNLFNVHKSPKFTQKGNRKSK